MSRSHSPKVSARGDTIGSVALAARCSMKPRVQRMEGTPPAVGAERLHSGYLGDIDRSIEMEGTGGRQIGLGTSSDGCRNGRKQVISNRVRRLVGNLPDPDDSPVLDEGGRGVASSVVDEVVALRVEEADAVPVSLDVRIE